LELLNKTLHEMQSALECWKSPCDSLTLKLTTFHKVV